MCGIAAIFSQDPDPGMLHQIERCLETISNRGPDGRGIVLGDKRAVLAGEARNRATWGLGHVRLAILDLTDSGSQPMTCGQGKLWIVHNGEVYNYLELRRELQERGYRFRGDSDTEVIMASYQEWGPSCVKRFNGMFALVIVDLERGNVFAARDRLGIKPLYLWWGATFVIAVSEIKALIPVSEFHPTVHRQHLVDFLIDGVVNDDPDSTFFEGVVPLPPGHWLTWPIDGLPSMYNAESYWKLQPKKDTLSWTEAVDGTAKLFQNAVAIRLRSDVPVGSCLSGGVDSSSIVGVAGKELGYPLRTITSCFPGKRFDEEEYARAVSTHCGTEFLRVLPSMAQAVSDLEELVYRQDEPFSSLSVFAQWCVMQAARKAKVPVLLDGQGGDEVLCGYRKYAWFYARTLFAEKRLGKGLSHLAQLLLNGDRTTFQLSEGSRYLPWRFRARAMTLVNMLRPEWRSLARPVRYDSARTISELSQHQIDDLTKWSLPSLLRYEDRNSMAHGIEARLPFLDYRLLEHFLSMPDEFFFRGGRTKRLLVEAVGDALPKAVIGRRTKLAFDTAEDEWMRSDLGYLLENRVRRSFFLADIMDNRAAAEAFANYRTGRAPVSRRTLWRIGCLAIWADRFQVDGYGEEFL